ncbi:MAG: class II aldolase/adducin family protein [Halioglobus sp.]|nr:class II aldolase/adducin family protein [Halioglobus sp.]
MSQYRNDSDSRQQVVDGLRWLVEQGLTSGTSGNVSVAAGDDRMLITPTGIAPADLQPEHIVYMNLDGSVADDQLTPSSEWRMHADIYRNKPGLEAVVHCHSNYATVLACARKPIPALHYMVAATGANGVPLADYATFGTQSLSDAVIAALDGALACLMSNHGQLTTGMRLDGALKLAEMVEEFARWYWGVLAMGTGPVLLDAGQMDEVLAAFAGYGQQK